MAGATELNRNNHSQRLGDYIRQGWKRSGFTIGLNASGNGNW